MMQYGVSNSKAAYDRCQHVRPYDTGWASIIRERKCEWKAVRFEEIKFEPQVTLLLGHNPYNMTRFAVNGAGQSRAIQSWPVLHFRWWKGSHVLFNGGLWFYWLFFFYNWFSWLSWTLIVDMRWEAGGSTLS